LARSRAADYSDKRQAILDQAARLFADIGYQQTSMAEIASACGVSKALLYHYYKGKEDILFDVIGGHLEELCAVVKEADDPSLPVEDRLYALVMAILESYQNADAEHTVQISALRVLPDEKKKVLHAMERELVSYFAVTLSDIDPAFAPPSPLLKPLTMSLFGMLNWNYLWFNPDGPMSREDYARMASQLIVRGAKSLIA